MAEVWNIQLFVFDCKCFCECDNHMYLYMEGWDFVYWSSVYNFLLHSWYVQPDDGSFVAETCICHCYNKVAHLQAIFLLLLYILEAQQGYHTLKKDLLCWAFYRNIVNLIQRTFVICLYACFDSINNLKESCVYILCVLSYLVFSFECL